MKRAKRKLVIGGALGSLLVLVVASPAMAQEEPGFATQFILDNLWVFIAGVLVTIGLRVTPEEELSGLDVEEHGSPGYGIDPSHSAGIGVSTHVGVASSVAVPSGGEGSSR